MRCRYCGKELALLKRLTGGGGFCSEAHKQSYQDEYNQLALSRLLQAQKKDQTQPSGQTSGTPVAVEEPAVEEPVREADAAKAPVTESAPLEIISLGASVAEDATARDARIRYGEQSRDAPEEAAAEPAAEPMEIANFLIDSPAMAVLPDETPHLEPWLEFSSGPAVADWQFQNGAATLSTASLVSLDLQPNASPVEHPIAPANLTPQEFANGHGRPTPPWKVTTTHRLPSAGPVSIEVTASAIDFAADRSIAAEVGFETAVLVEDAQLLELPSTGIELPAEDSRVVVVFRPDNRLAVDFAPSEADPAAPAEDDSPGSSLDALSRLHHDLVVQEDLVQEDHVQPEEAAPGESATLVAEPVPVAEAQPPSGEPTPGRATELLDIAIRMFPPAKPVPIEGAGLASQAEPLLPHLKSLPLRPKVAVASGYVPPLTAPAQPKAIASAPQAATRPTVPSKPAPAARPAARITQPKQQPKQPPAPAKAPETSKPAAKFHLPSQAAASKTAPPAPARPETGQSAKPGVEETAREIAKPAAKQPPIQPLKQIPGEPAPEIGPNFGAVQLANTSVAGSLKVKLGIAITLLVVACSTWLGWGGKSRKAASNPAISADGSGPSIILGEGGWVEGWGGDASGLHADRQITIYRPSLKLSDYRIEFQASIDTKSIGWVFRAADPDNYYAMKLTAVPSGLSPKVALFKYLVINGRQTQVGRVPIDLTVQTDTVFNIRTDVRGPQFSTYIQGRQVDVWTDDQLKAGGVGFLNEREERGKVKSVSIRYLNGAAK
jgi:hypothetical protein